MDISFESFSSLVYRLGNPRIIPPSRKPSDPKEIFTSWLRQHPGPLVEGSCKHFFRLLFPYEGSRRRYGMLETKLAKQLEKILALQGLKRWDAVGWGDEGTGCLGLELERVLKERLGGGVTETKSDISIREVNDLLDRLAALSPWSQLSQEFKPIFTSSQILTRLYRDSRLSSYALAVLTQIILRDLRPFVDPLPSLPVRNPTAMLRLKSNTGPTQLTLFSAFRCWDPRLALWYDDGKGSVDYCADMVERAGVSVPAGPVVGLNVQIPKCLKGHSVDQALKQFAGTRNRPSARMIWAETKYDGIRMQIHVQIRDNGVPEITVYSKSKRNSTADRLNTHAIILASLGLPRRSGVPSHPTMSRRLANISGPAVPMKRSVILEAEVVPYNEGQREGGRGPGIEEFFWLEHASVRVGKSDRNNPLDGPRHLCLCFFDILHLDGNNLLKEPLSRRRQLLESCLMPIPGFSLLAEYIPIPLDSRHLSLTLLETAFQRSNQKCEEGLILKAPESSYFDSRWRWVKLKKDYIPNLGDCIDLVMLGAGWDMDRARGLRVDTSVFTTFYIGVLTNREMVKAKRETPHFEILFKTSYGPSRDHLEILNDNIRHGRWPTKSYDRDDPNKRRLLGLSWTYKIREGMNPSVLFENPLCVEVMGAGFQKVPGSKLYELRWPRLQKVWERNERSWVDALTAEQLLTVAHQALGYDISIMSLAQLASPESNSMKAMWRSSSSVAVTDMPDLPSPVASPERPSPRRIRSAPDLTTNPTPSPRLIGAKRSLAGGGENSPKKSKGLASSRALASVMLGLDKENEHARSVMGIGRVKDRSGEDGKEREWGADEADREVLFTPSPLKRARVIPAPRHLEEEVIEATYPGVSGVQVSSLSFGGILDGQIGKSRLSRPLSLRSRIRLALIKANN